MIESQEGAGTGACAPNWAIAWPSHGVEIVTNTGSVTIGKENFQFAPRDTFVVPSWFPLEIQADSEAVLFSFSDRPGQEAMGLCREKRG